MSSVWIDAFKLGSEIHYRGRIIEVNQPMLDEAETNFSALSTKGYRFPFKREHGTVDSFQYGELKGTRQKDGYLSIAIEMYREEERKAFGQGIMREFSVGFDTDWIDPHTGENHGMVIYEMSFTSEGYQKVLRDPTDINSGVALRASQLIEPGADTMARTKIELAAKPEPLEETDVEMADGAEPTIADLLKRIEALEATLASKEDDTELMAEEEEGDKTAALSARIAELEGQNVRLQLSAKGIKGDVVPGLVKLHATDKSLFASTVKMLSAQAEIGAVGQAETGTVKLSAKDVAAAAVAAGQSGHGRLAAFVATNHPDFEINEVRAALSAK